MSLYSVININKLIYLLFLYQEHSVFIIGVVEAHPPEGVGCDVCPRRRSRYPNDHATELSWRPAQWWPHNPSAKIIRMIS